MKDVAWFVINTALNSRIFDVRSKQHRGGSGENIPAANVRTTVKSDAFEALFYFYDLVSDESSTKFSASTVTNIDRKPRIAFRSLNGIVFE